MLFLFTAVVQDRSIELKISQTQMISSYAWSVGSANITVTATLS